MNNFFTKRKTERENYKIIKFTRKNKEVYYKVKFKTYLLGWRYLYEYTGYELHTCDSSFLTKDDAKSRIEHEILYAFQRIGNTTVKSIEVNAD